MSAFPYLTGFESTYMPHARTDALALTHHLELWREDLDLVAEAGVRCLRYAAPWHRIERERGTYEWGWMDEVMGYLRESGFDPIADIIHHTSFPDWLDEGMANPLLPAALCEFAQAFAERYPWVRRYTVFNEPFLTAFMCGHQGVWYPYGVGPRSFVPMLLNVGRAVCQVSALLIGTVPDVQLIHVETCESHQALDREAEGFAAFLNDRRFLMHDLVLGGIGDGHPLHGYLSGHGFTPEDARWFAEHAARIDVLGLDYYVHSEHGFHREGSVVPSPVGRGFAAVARDYVDRYRLPVMLSETNIRGYSSDRLSWCKYMIEQCEQLVGEGVDFRGFCWFPFVDSTDWDSLLREARGHIDPQGVYWLDPERRVRHRSVFSEHFGRLARGEETAGDLPAYRFRPPVDAQVAALLPQMAHWEWREPPAE